MAKDPFDLEDILRVAGAAGQNRNPMLSSASFSFSSAGDDDRPMMAHDYSVTARSNETWRPRGQSIQSATTDQTYSSCFSDASSGLTSLTTPSLPSTVGEQPTAVPIPCDFCSYTGCQRQFHYVSLWIDHCFGHYGYYGQNLPRTSVCWFCDLHEYRAPSDTFEVKRLYFENRLLHIGEHYAAGTQGHAPRTDHFVLEHMYSIGAIDRARYNQLNIRESPWLGTWEENNNIGQRPTRFRVAGEVEVANSRSQHGRRRRR